MIARAMIAGARSHFLDPRGRVSGRGGTCAFGACMVEPPWSKEPCSKDADRARQVRKVLVNGEAIERRRDEAFSQRQADELRNCVLVEAVARACLGGLHALHDG